MKIKIYSGLSLSETEVKRVFRKAIFSGPVQRSNLSKDISDGIHVVAIIDGVFKQDLAVSINEILDAIRCGLRIYGSSSLGALRAAELQRFGMIGHGQIFEAIQAGPFFKDDYLAQIFFEDDEMGSGLPLMDAWFLLERLDPSVRERIIRKFAKIHFSFRTKSILKDFLKAEGLKPDIFLNRQSAKKKDGLSLLQRIRRDLAGIQKLNAQLNRRPGQPEF